MSVTVLVAVAALAVPAALSGMTVGASALPALTPVQQLGRQLFYDTGFSNPTGMSCATCHYPTAAFTDPRGSSPIASQTLSGQGSITAWSLGQPTSAGALPGRWGSRNSPSAAYAAYSPPLHYDAPPRPGIMPGLYIGGLFWDGRAATLEEQAMAPPLNPVEMHMASKQAIVAKLRQNYTSALRSVFGSRALKSVDGDYALMTEAIAAYERSAEVCRFDSKYDRYVADPNGAPLTDSEARGLALFSGKAKCFNCHSMDTSLAGAALFTHFGHQNIGVPANPANPHYFLPASLNSAGMGYVDRGLGDVVNEPNEYGKFRIPSLRNVAITAPYMHNGVFKTLREVVDFDNTRDVSSSWPPPEVNMNVHRHMPPMAGTFGRLGLTSEESDDIVAFLKTLTDGYEPGAVASVIIDNGQPGTLCTGTWAVSAAANAYGADSVWGYSGATYTWTFRPTVTATYRVSMCWTALATRSASVPVKVTYAGGTAGMTVNQTMNGGTWNVLGQWQMNAGTAYTVRITAPKGSPPSTSADAVRFEQL